MTTKTFLVAAALACATLASPVFAQAPKAGDDTYKAPQAKSPAEQRKEVQKNVQETIARYKKADPSIERFFKESVGYVVYPRVGKAGFIFAGGHGDGEVFEHGKVIGFASITLASIGLTVGAQEYSEIIFFETPEALGRFKQNKFVFGATASAVIVKSGAAKDKSFSDGVVVFTHATGGAMAEASLGTQKFSFKP